MKELLFVRASPPQPPIVEYVRLSQSTHSQCLNCFATTVVDSLGSEWLGVGAQFERAHMSSNGVLVDVVTFLFYDVLRLKSINYTAPQQILERVLRFMITGGDEVSYYD